MRLSLCVCALCELRYVRTALTHRYGRQRILESPRVLRTEILTAVEALHAMSGNRYSAARFATAVRTSCPVSCVGQTDTPCGLAYTPCGFSFLLMLDMIEAETWEHVPHHMSHASLGLWDSPFKRPLVMSYDGGGNDGVMNFFLGNKLVPSDVSAVFDGVSSALQWVNVWKGAIKTPVEDPKHVTNLGRMYAMLGSVIAAINPALANSSEPMLIPSWDTFLSIPGKLMAFAGLAPPISVVAETIDLRRVIAAFDSWFVSSAVTGEQWFFRVPFPKSVATRSSLPGTLLRQTGLEFDNSTGFLASERNQEVFATLIQYAFEQLAVGYLTHVLTHSLESDTLRVKIPLHGGGSEMPIDGIVVTGGCALNVKANDAIRIYALKTFGLDTFVPSAPGDNGLPVGAAWLINPPIHEPRPYGALAFGGPRPFDEGSFDLASAVPASTVLRSLPPIVSHTSDAELVAADLEHFDAISALFDNSAIVAMVRGRTEVGPRALGHRSLLAYPASIVVKEKLNAIKSRAWYRPVAPIVTEDLTFFMLSTRERGGVETNGVIFSPCVGTLAPAVPCIAPCVPVARSRWDLHLESKLGLRH